MKNIFKYISFCLIAVVGLSSCEPDDNGYRDENREVGGYAYLQTRSLTVFDFDQDLNIELFTAEGVTIESVEIIENGSTLTTADISGDMATFNAADLGAFAVDSTFSVKVRSNLSNGEISEEPATISVVEAVELGDDNPEEAAINMLDDVELEYTVSTTSAPIDEVNLWVKNGEEAEYMMIEDLDLPTDEGSVSMSDFDYSGLDLEVGDVIFYQFAATRGELTEGAEGEIEVLEFQEEEEEEEEEESEEEGDDSEGDDSEGDDSEGDDSEGDDSEGDDSEGDDSEGDDSDGDDSDGDDSDGDDSDEEE
ncbi:hypothetical protein [Salegentibacter sp. Hel_I_6]|uniref:hypothetical protein n=1 Tax=Salegentibacter sp. Hel_I_6 TaxID=1250278 RepID=UPI00068C4401|nr:hypothetical protein [Salegentibacter sp. Hel_I_6]